MRNRIVIIYVVLVVAVAAITTIVITLGNGEHAAPSIAGTYSLTQGSNCLGDSGKQLGLKQSGQFIDADTGHGKTDQLRFQGSTLSGDLHCADGRTASTRLDFRTSGSAPEFSGTVGSEPVSAKREALSEAAAGGGPVQKRSAEETFGRLMIAMAVVILAARLAGAVMKRIGQPQVMGEVLAGILLGPTLLGTIAPDLKDYFFPSDIVPLLTAAANIGLAFFMFLVGLELDPAALRGRVAQAALISNVSAAFPIMLGILFALPLYSLLGPDHGFVPFALFIGVSMSITAFPVLARIVLERRMLKRPVGAVSLSAAAVDDVTAWTMLALASAVAGAGSAVGVVKVLGLATLFCALMALVGRRLLARVSKAYDEAGFVPPGWIATIFVGILVSAFLAQQIGIAAIFGAFVMGMIMPRRSDLTHEVNGRVESFVVTVLLPLFFVVTGLKTEVGLLNRPVLWLITLVLLLVAITGKFVGAAGAARLVGFRPREAAAIGALMNTRGLTELIVLNIGLELGVITPALFAMLVIMALVTTFMAGPLLKLIDPSGGLSAPVEDDLRDAERVAASPGAAMPERSILVASVEGRNLDALLAIAEPLARFEPPRELIMASLVVPTRLATGLAGDNQELAEANAELTRRRAELTERGIAARVVAFTSADPGEDLLKLAAADEIDLVLVDGRRPLLGEGVPRGPAGPLLSEAPADVAVLVAPDFSPPVIGPENAVIVPFGGADHDWTALELGAWIARVREAPLKLLGAKGKLAEGQRDASLLLANASLVVQQFAGITCEPLLVDPSRDAILSAAAEAGLLVLGLSERWRQEGLGPMRSEIARAAPVATLFVRRGQRPGALSPAEGGTRFAWSEVAPPPRR